MASARFYQAAKLKLAEAIQYDEQLHLKEAAPSYALAISYLCQGAAVDDDRRNAASMERMAQQYQQRLDQLNQMLQRTPAARQAAAGSAPSSHTPSAVEQAAKLERRGDLQLRNANEAVGNMQWYDARKRLEQAAQTLLDARKLIVEPSDCERLDTKITATLDKLQRLKVAQSDSPNPRPSPPPAPIATTAARSSPTNSESSLPGAGTNPSVVPADSESYTPAELSVLRETSSINGRVYLPWVPADANDHIDRRGRFSDPDGHLAFSPKQRSHGAVWARPADLHANPSIIREVHSKNVRQTLVSDCSFVSALAISADYERRFKRRLVTGAIYPQNSHGHPIYNPCGKYLLRLHFNGTWRKVIIDDQLPVDAGRHSLLCSYSANPDEFWVSLLEKAYLKVVANSYDFPGSNSSVDLHAMTGWIPDRLPISDCTDDLWHKLFRGLHAGNVVLTAATGELSELKAKRAGLVPTHAYAILDMREVNGLKLLRLKNPWAHLRWLGNFSPYDTRNWTEDLQRRLQYKASEAVEHDDGTFWIDWPSVQHFYDVMYMNWKPDRFLHHKTFHYCWRQDAGPVKDAYNMEHNPQYRVEVDAGEDCEMWILLSRHITRLNDFANNEEFIGVHVFGGGERIYYPQNHISQAVKINSPHHLTKIKVPRGKQPYTLVISQFEKTNTLNFTVKVYCTHKIRMKALPNPFPEVSRVVSQWTAQTAGGCANYPQTFGINPKFQFLGPGSEGTATPVLVKLEGPRQYSVGFEIRGSDGSKVDVPTYRSGFVYTTLTAKGGVKYTITPTTFQPGQEGAFFLTVASKIPLRLYPMPTA